MEEEERPHKLQKLDRGDDDQEVSVPAVTDAVESVGQADTHNETSTTDNADNANADDGQQPKDGEDGDAAPISKRQIKRLRKQAEWEAGREDRKIRRKEKLVARKDRRRAEFAEAKSEGKEALAKLKKERERTRDRFRRSTLLPVTLVMDCGYDDLMLEKERISLSSQISRSYSENSRSPFRTHFVVSSFDKLLKERFNTVMRKTHVHWQGVRILDEDWVHASEQAKEWMKAPKGGEMAGMFSEKTDAKPEDGEVIYLSSDSPHTLTELKPYSTYIVGGLVDKNRHKAVCYKQAVAKGYKTAKLPIGDYIQMASRAVLTTNHVIEIMLRWLELGDWGKAFMQVLPQRKGGSLKDLEQELERDAEEQAQGAESAEAESVEAGSKEPETSTTDAPEGDAGASEVVGEAATKTN